MDSIGYSNDSRNITDDFRALPADNRRDLSRLEDLRRERLPVTNRNRHQDSRYNEDLRSTEPEYRNDSRYSPVRDRDPFIPAPLPESQLDDETTKIDELITIRYQNPVTVRAIRAMTTTQAVNLFSEVSQKIDERSVGTNEL